MRYNKGMEFVEVPMLTRKVRARPGVGATAKSKAHKAKLLEFLRDPPEDFDGTNAAIGKHLGLSARQAQRLLLQLVSENKVQLRYQRKSMPETAVKADDKAWKFSTVRFILVAKETA
jgi:hypothetical protein